MAQVAQMPLQGMEAPVIARANAVIDEEGLTLDEAAREIGVSPTMLSQLRSGTYPSRPDRGIRQIEAWLRLRGEAARHGQPRRSAHAELSVSTEIETLFMHAQGASDCVLVYGAAGSGKTYSARRYVARQSQAWLATMSPAVRSPLALLRRVADAVGVELRSARSAAALEDGLVHHLRNRRALLIIDEAHHLSQALLDEIRCVHDRGGCGLAYVGNEPLWPRLAGGERAAQLVSRIGPYRLRLGRPGAGDAEALATTMLGRPLQAPERKLVCTVAARAGGLRGIVQTVHAAHAYALGRGAEGIAREDLAAAAGEG